MQTENVIHQLRVGRGLSQDELAEKVFVTRQAVSRWENGETVPNTETLKLLSGLFDVSINTLLGSPRRLICQCCGMPLEDAILGRDRDGALNENYCRWCYTNGTWVYHDMDALIDACAGHMATDAFPEEQVRAYLRQTLPGLDYWKKYGELSENGELEAFRARLIGEINALKVEGMPEVKALTALPADFSPEVRLADGTAFRFPAGETPYLGARLESEFGTGQEYGVLANMAMIAVYLCGTDGSDPELLLYKKR